MAPLEIGAHPADAAGVTRVGLLLLFFGAPVAGSIALRRAATSPESENYANQEHAVARLR